MNQIKNHIPQKLQDRLVSSGPQMETGTKEPFRWYTARVHPSYPHYPCTGPFPHLLFHPTFCEVMKHWVQLSVSISLISCSFTFVGIMSWTNMYHADLAPSDNLTLWRLPHTSDQSIFVWICMIRISRGLFCAVNIVGKVYTSHLKALSVSACLWGSKYAHSWK